MQIAKRGPLTCRCLLWLLMLTASHDVMAMQLECGTARTSIEVLEVRLGAVPALVRVPPAITKPPIILWHGFGPPDSEAALMQALPLDEVAAIKVYLGLPLFGQRAPARGTAEIIERQTRDMALEIFEPVVLGAAKELAGVMAALIESGCATRQQHIGLFGFSAGGAAVFQALAERDVPIGAAVTLNASTGLSASIEAFERATGREYPHSQRSRALALRSDATVRAAEIAAGTPPPALLIIHGARDTMLPPRIASAVHEALQPHYAKGGNASRLVLSSEPGLGHGWSDAAQLPGLRVSVANFFGQHL